MKSLPSHAWWNQSYHLLRNVDQPKSHLLTGMPILHLLIVLIQASPSQVYRAEMHFSCFIDVLGSELVAGTTSLTFFTLTRTKETSALAAPCRLTKMYGLTSGSSRAFPRRRVQTVFRLTLGSKVIWGDAGFTLEEEERKRALISLQHKNLKTPPKNVACTVFQMQLKIWASYLKYLD